MLIPNKIPHISVDNIPASFRTLEDYLNYMRERIETLNKRVEKLEQNSNGGE